MINQQISIRLLGTRGSFPIADQRFAKYGGDTMCVLVTYLRKQMIIDIGSGVTRIDKYIEDKNGVIPILVSHAHIDHIIGILGYSKAYTPKEKLEIYSLPRGGYSCKDQIATLFSQPIWPLTIADLLADIDFIDIKENIFEVAEIKVEWIDSHHPGGSSIYKLNFCKKKIVYATDFEHNINSIKELENFSKDADILFYDGQFTEEEYPSKIGWGHSTWRQGIEIAKNSNVEKVVIIHHNPNSDDDKLDTLQHEIDEFRKENALNGILYPSCVLGKSEEEFLF